MARAVLISYTTRRAETIALFQITPELLEANVSLLLT